MNCRACGAPLGDGARFCTACGTPVSGEQASATSTGGVSGRLFDRLSSVMGERYRILRPLGRGGMSYVFLAEERRLDRRVALKVLAPHLAEDPSIVDRFMREARTVARLGHPNIVSIYDVGEVDDLHYFVMQFMAGKTLSQILKTRTAPLDLPVVTTWLTQAGGALDVAHRHDVVHRDIKPGNILFDKHGNAHIADFGIAKLEHVPRLTQVGMVLGTPVYMSPEQFLAQAEIGPASDQYSLGVVAYEMLSGSPPFSGSDVELFMAHRESVPRPLREIRPEIPEKLADAVARMLAKEPGDRFPTVGQAVSAMEGRLPGPGDPLTAVLADLTAPTSEIRIEAGEEVTVETGGRVSLDATVYAEDGHPLQSRQVEWSTENDDVATVTPQGVVVGIAEGDATIVATCEGVAARRVVRVVAPGAAASRSNSAPRFGDGTDAPLEIERGDVLDLGGETTWGPASGETPAPSRDEPTPTPVPDEPTSPPVAREPTPTPVPEEPTPPPVVREPTPTPVPDEPTPPPVTREPTPTPVPEEPTPPPVAREPTPTPVPEEPTPPPRRREPVADVPKPTGAPERKPALPVKAVSLVLVVIAVLAVGATLLMRGPAEPGSLVVEGDVPPGTEIRLTGAGGERTLAPGQVAELPPGDYELRATASGFEPFVAGVSIAEGELSRLDVELTPVADTPEQPPVEQPPSRATLLVDRSGLPAGADLTLVGPGGERPLPSGDRVELDAGSYTLRASAEGFVPTETEVTLEAGQESRFAPRLEPAPVRSGTLVVTSQLPPQARVTIQGGGGTWTLPPSGRIDLPPGTYRVEASAPGHRSATSEARIREGASTRIEVAPTPLPRDEPSIPEPTTGTLTVDGDLPPQGRIEILGSGGPAAASPGTPVELPAGSYTVRASAPGYDPVEVAASVRAGESSTVSLPGLRAVVDAAAVARDAVRQVVDLFDRRSGAATELLPEGERNDFTTLWTSPSVSDWNATLGSIEGAPTLSDGVITATFVMRATFVNNNREVPADYRFRARIGQRDAAWVVESLERVH